MYWFDCKKWLKYEFNGGIFKALFEFYIEIVRFFKSSRLGFHSQFIDILINNIFVWILFSKLVSAPGDFIPPPRYLPISSLMDWKPDTIQTPSFVPLSITSRFAIQMAKSIYPTSALSVICWIAGNGRHCLPFSQFITINCTEARAHYIQYSILWPLHQLTLQERQNFAHKLAKYKVPLQRPHQRKRHADHGEEQIRDGQIQQEYICYRAHSLVLHQCQYDQWISDDSQQENYGVEWYLHSSHCQPIYWTGGDGGGCFDNCTARGIG